MTEHWLTTHWPHSDHHDHPWDVYLRRGHEDLARLLARGHGVPFYESVGGKTRLQQLSDGTLKPVPIPRGRGGIVRVGEVSGRYGPQTALPPVQRYTDGKVIDWAWQVPVRTVTRDGFVARVDVLKVLGLAPGYTMRGFGERQSGLRGITRQQFQDLLLLFNSKTR